MALLASGEGEEIFGVMHALRMLLFYDDDDARCDAVVAGGGLTALVALLAPGPHDFSPAALDRLYSIVRRDIEHADAMVQAGTIAAVIGVLAHRSLPPEPTSRAARLLCIVVCVVVPKSPLIYYHVWQRSSFIVVPAVGWFARQVRCWRIRLLARSGARCTAAESAGKPVTMSSGAENHAKPVACTCLAWAAQRAVAGCWHRTPLRGRSVLLSKVTASFVQVDIQSSTTDNVCTCALVITTNAAEERHTAPQSSGSACQPASFPRVPLTRAST